MSLPPPNPHLVGKICNFSSPSSLEWIVWVYPENNSGLRSKEILADHRQFLILECGEDEFAFENNSYIVLVSIDGVPTIALVDSVHIEEHVATL
jgi:hypothetical protein